MGAVLQTNFCLGRAIHGDDDETGSAVDFPIPAPINSQHRSGTGHFRPLFPGVCMPDLDAPTDNAGLFGSWKPSEYIEKRTQQYQAWYDRKAVTAKTNYLRMRTAIVLGGVVVPVIVNSALPQKDVVDRKSTRLNSSHT